MKHLLDFEKPISDLQHKLTELRTHTEGAEFPVDFDDEIRRMEQEIDKKRAEIYANLTAWQRVQLARHPKRPYALDYITRSFSGFSELHGDRLFDDDRAIVAGFARLGSHKVMVIGTQKGRDTKENIMRNFGCAHPEGYRKAIRLMGLANRFGLPIITLIDTAGAYPGVAAEERHIAKAIAINLREMSLFSVPMIALVIGEGGSGGALGIGVCDRVLILENSYYSVISPEGCASILWKDRAAAPQAAEALKITARDLHELGLVDEVLPEPLGGAHHDHEAAAKTVQNTLIRHLEELQQIDPDERLRLRYEKFRNIGEYIENPAAA
ncbi:MAG: acetyl-CoA carboxylase carboxyl transferase subunit alpha [Verrucomicrobiales bacterium]|nr:acetyl-CoA carboxylase carboxyl transferase subunit alpha [Verrucomicrobiales bacterium]|tara:strand:- start:59694 stop:60668 length:975 start_codon:yes stop_codon:yes gene_type:complete